MSSTISTINFPPKPDPNSKESNKHMTTANNVNLICDVENVYKFIFQVDLGTNRFEHKVNVENPHVLVQFYRNRTDLRMKRKIVNQFYRKRLK